jgi:hypothetical protein
MPRVIVTTDPSRRPDDIAVLLDEQVHTIHLGSGHAAAQFVERIAWAISDAEDAESVAAAPAVRVRRPLARRRARVSLRAEEALPLA